MVQASRIHDRTIFVTGSSGFIGRQLIRTLARGAANIVALYRHRMPESLNHVFPVCSDLSNIDIIKIPLRGASTVIHLAWESSFKQPPGQAERWKDSVNLSALRNLLQAMEIAKTKRLIFMSVQGASPDDPSFFKREKYWAEHMILNSGVPEKLILRAPLVIGPVESGYFLYKSVKDALKIPFILPLPSFKKIIKPIHVDDLVASLSMLTDAPLKDATLISDMEGAEEFNSEQLIRLIQSQVDGRMRLGIRGRLANFLLGMTEIGKPGSAIPPLSQCLTTTFREESRAAIGNLVEGLLHQQNHTSIRAIMAKPAKS
jgi:nucleoside-diphosphate-sugar epimerase